MTQIDFHILEDATPQACLHYVCRLTEKAYTQGCQIHIHTADENMTEQLDELLWTFRERSFIPHQANCAEHELCAVTLNHAELPEKREVLINLSAQVPSSYAQFDRIIEVIANDETLKQQGRARFRYYTERGEAPTHQQLKTDRTTN